MSNFKVILTGPIDDAGTKMLKEVAQVTISDPAESILMDDIVNVDAVIARAPAKITRNILDRAKRLKVIGRYGVGFDDIDIAAATEKGIPVVYAPGANVASVAQHTICLITALANRLFWADRALKEGRWKLRYKYEGIELCGKTIGIVGFGNIGAEVARICKALGMEVSYFDNIRRQQLEKELGVEFVRLTCKDKKEGLRVPRKLLQKSSVISIHLPLTDQTRNMIDTKEVRFIKKGAFLINTARGGIVNEMALYNGLRSGKLAGLGLDVFEEEPPSPGNPLLELENVIGTPHIAGVTKDSSRRIAVMIAEDIIKVLHGEIPSNLANPEVFRTSRAQQSC